MTIHDYLVANYPDEVEAIELELAAYELHANEEPINFELQALAAGEDDYS